MWFALRAVWRAIEASLDPFSLARLWTGASDATSPDTIARLSEKLVQLGQPGHGRVNGQLQRIFQALVEPCIRLRTHPTGRSGIG